jgi:quercetin dioxygenase-like cupin family protein
VDTEHGNGWAVGSIDGLGSGPGIRKIRRELGVTAFGVNAIVLPPGYSTPAHHHERQQELYIVFSGEIEFTLGGETRTLGPGGLARVDAGTVRHLRNLSDDSEAVFVAFGGEGGYVGRDGVSDA